MIAINKNFEDIPNSLLDDSHKKAFGENIKAGKYVSGNIYKKKDVQDKLNEIYYKKCAYCEKTLLDTDKHIEHYRPKSTYFWLAFNWDNLLLASAECNRKKKANFKIEGKKVTFNDYKSLNYEDIQNKITEIDKKEKPLTINPEQEKQDFFDKNLSFCFSGECIGQISSTEKRLKHTIEVCDINRKELVERRLEILNDIKNAIAEYKYLAVKSGSISQLIENLTALKKIEIKKITPEREFIAWRKTIIYELLQIYIDTK